MGTVDDVIKLARAGGSARTISEQLGISRQRVYRIAADHKIKLERSVSRRVTPDSERKRTRRIQPRFITGGAEVLANTQAVGAISEMLVACDLMARGWSVFMPIYRSKIHDIIAVKDDKMITIEVRSSYRNASGKLIFGKKPQDKSDHYALVITGEVVQYEPDIG